MGRKTEEEGTVFPFPSGQLLERGLAELGFPAGEGLFPADGNMAAGASASAGAEASGGMAAGATAPEILVRGAAGTAALVNRYIRELELFNAVFDLVGAEPGTDRGRQDLVVRHMLDSLAPWKELAGVLRNLPSAGTGPRVFRLADAGSGAGFPGIPLAIIFPGIQFTLIERMSKRCAFLENCAAILGLKNVTVLNAEVEKAPAGAFDVVVFRAFRPLDREMVRTLLRLLAPGGMLAAWKAKRDRIGAEMSAIEEEVSGWEVRPLSVPFLGHEERNLVLTTSAERPSRQS